jgi:hypothetical protein
MGRSRWGLGIPCQRLVIAFDRQLVAAAIAIELNPFMSLGSLVLGKQLGFYGRDPTIFPIVEQKIFSCPEIGLPNIYYALDPQRMRGIWIKLLPLLGQLGQ